MCNVCVLNVFSGPVSKCLTPQIASFTPIDFARRTATQFTFTITARATPHGWFSRTKSVDWHGYLDCSFHNSDVLRFVIDQSARLSKEKIEYKKTFLPTIFFAIVIGNVIEIRKRYR